MSRRVLVVGTDSHSGPDPSGASNLNCCTFEAESIMEILVSAFGLAIGRSVRLLDRSASSAHIAVVA